MTFKKTQLKIVKRNEMEEVKKSEEEQTKLNQMRDAHKKRSRDIAAKCNFADKPLSDGAKEAANIIEIIFEEATTEIAMMLPGEFRTALCLEHLEAACMWAKKAIYSHDQELAKLQLKEEQLKKEFENGASNNEN